METYRGKIAGWGSEYKKGKPSKPFTPTQFKKSHIKKTVKGYENYLKYYNKLKYKPKKRTFSYGLPF